MSKWFFGTKNDTDLFKPSLSGHAALLIPCHMHNNHWVALVHREMAGQVTFLYAYADDLNCTSTERQIKRTLQTLTHPTFFPPNAAWINSRSFTFNPHQNECGLHMPLALAYMALHPSPTSDIVLPPMYSIFAQICRTWVAACITNKHITIPSFHHSWSPLFTSKPIWSEQYHPIDWEKYNNLPKTPTTAQESPSQLTSLSSALPTTNNASTTPPTTPIHLPSHCSTLHSPNNSSNHIVIPSNLPTRVKTVTTKLTNPIKRKLPTFINDYFSSKTNKYLHANAPDSDSTAVTVFGHTPPEIDITTAFRLILQNPNGFNLVECPEDFRHFIENSSDLGAGFIGLTETNINWNQPNHIQQSHSIVKRYHCTSILQPSTHPDPQLSPI